MGRKQMLSIFCIVVISVCITSIFFLLFDIACYLNIIDIMITKIFYSIRVIFVLIIILFFFLLILLRS
jgi:hypothetical protein